MSIGKGMEGVKGRWCYQRRGDGASINAIHVQIALWSGRRAICFRRDSRNSLRGHELTHHVRRRDVLEFAKQSLYYSDEDCDDGDPFDLGSESPANAGGAESLPSLPLPALPSSGVLIKPRLMTLPLVLISALLRFSLASLACLARKCSWICLPRAISLWWCRHSR